MDFAEKRKRKEAKRLRLLKQKENGVVLFAHGKGYGLLNDEESRGGKRRYGFQRTSVHQKGRVKNKRILEYRRRKAIKIRCFTHNSYLSSSEINALYKSKRINCIVEKIYLAYKDVDTLLDDYNHGFRDRVFSSLYALSGSRDDHEIVNIIKNNYDDILSGAIIKFMESHKNYVKEAASYYSFITGTFHYHLLTQLHYYIKSGESEQYYDTEDEAYRIEGTINLLGFHILNGFVDLKNNKN